MRGGAGKTTIHHYWKKDEMAGNERLCSRIELEPGSSIGFHEHNDEEEIFIIISGEGEVVDGDTTSTVKAGDTILTGGGAGHSIKAIGDETLVFVALIVQF
jgi:mannose-6-phosphate isomerase-like protein (cupin superfamily)